MAQAKAKKPAKGGSAAKKKNQDEWDDLLKFVRTLSRECGFPVGADSNLVLKLCEEYGSAGDNPNAPFPPKQMILSARPLDDSASGAQWIRILCQVLTSKQCATYTNFFLSGSYQGLRALCLWGCDVGDQGTQHICELALPQLPYCTKLELMDCGIGVRACEFLSASLKQRRTTRLKILRLDHNPGIGVQGVARLSEGLYFNSTLTNLSMAYCDIGTEGGVFLQAILTTRDIGIKTLNLEGNRLERAGVMSLSQGLLANRSLTSLSLASNNFGGGGGSASMAGSLDSELEALKYLVNAVGGAKQMRVLNIDGNLVGTTGLQLLLSAATSGLWAHVTELTVTPFAECGVYAALCEEMDSHAPKKTKKKKGKGKGKSSKKKK